MALVLVTAPAEEPVDFDRVKDHLRLPTVGGDIYDEPYVANAIVAARRSVENFLGRALVTQTWALYLDALPNDGVIELPLPPLRSVTAFEYKAGDYTGTLTTWAATNYIVDIANEPGRLALAYGITWPTLYSEIQAVKITFTCGYGGASSVPEAIVQALMMKTADLYEHRGGDEMQGQFAAGASGVVDAAVERLLWPYRMDIP